MRYLSLGVRTLTPVVAPILTLTPRQIERWGLDRKYGDDLPHIDRFFWRIPLFGKPQPCIMGSAVIGALNQQVPEFRKLRGRYGERIQCIGIFFSEDDVTLEKRVGFLPT